MAEDQRSAAHPSELELSQALEMCGMPFAVWEAPDGIVRLVNRPLEELVGLPADRLVGRPIPPQLSPHEAVEVTLNAVASGAVDSVRSRRTVERDDEAIPVWVWTRSATLDGRRVGISLIVPVARLGRLGRDPAAPWRDLAQIAVGVADSKWRIEVASQELLTLTGLSRSEIEGVSLFEVVQLDGGRRLGTPLDMEDLPANGYVTGADGAATEVCLLAAALDCDRPGRHLFAIVGRPDPGAAQHPSERVRELELRLRRIGAELRAAGILDEIGRLPAMVDYEELGALSSRQWEILSRLARGERVPQIASALYLSQSTVRNHLSAIFQKFGVHSQAELLELLRRSSPPAER